MVERSKAQPVEVVAGKTRLLVHNHEVANLLQQTSGSDLIEKSFALLQSKGTFEIPVNEQGVMVAASRGIYSKKAWHRDHARGVRAFIEIGDNEKARKMAFASIRQMATPAQLNRIKAGIKDPRVSFHNGDGALPQVIFNPDTLGDYNENWSSHKDAWGLYLHTVLDALENKLISLSELTTNEQAAFVGMLALMIRLEFWNFRTTDSWEEEHAVYTSGVGLVTGALERAADMLAKEGDNSALSQMLRNIAADKAHETSALELIQRSLHLSSILLAVQNGYTIIRKQLQHGGEAPFMRENNQGRKADTALLWLFFYRLNAFTEEDYRLVLSIAQTLVRDVGMLRYEAPYFDGYLNPAYFLPYDQVVPSELLRAKDPVIAGHVSGAFHRREINELIRLFGLDFSAQWSLGLIVFCQAYASMLKWFPDSPYIADYSNSAMEFFKRMQATISPSLEPAIALDGLDVAPFKIPEAITRVRIYHQFSDVKGSYSVYSPFTQLNWATAESLIAYKRLWDLFVKKPFPK